MNFIEIPGIDKEFNFDIYSPPDVDELRKEIEEEKIRKEKEGKKHALIKKRLVLIIVIKIMIWIIS